MQEVNRLMNSIPMNTSTGSRYGTVLIALCLVLALTPTAFAAGEWCQDFEKQLPGEWPAGWIQLWGNVGDDAFAICNTDAADGRQCLLLSRVGPAQYGLARRLPAVSTNAPSELAFKFKVRGPGHGCSFTIELRQGPGHQHALAHISVSHRRVTLVQGDRRATALLGEIEEDTWYGIRLHFPGNCDRPLRAVLSQLERSVDKVHERGIGTNTVSAMPAIPQPIYFSISTSPARSGYSLYLDTMELKDKVVSSVERHSVKPSLGWNVQQPTHNIQSP